MTDSRLYAYLKTKSKYACTLAIFFNFLNNIEMNIAYNFGVHACIKSFVDITVNKLMFSFEIYV